MSKQPSDKVKLTQILDDLVFMPSTMQRRIKAAFWTKFSQNPIADVGSITAELAARIAGNQNVKKWWSQPGFQEWFLNEDEFRQKLEYLAHLALDTIEEVLLNPDANVNAKSSMAKLIFEAAHKMPSKWQNTKYMDEQIQRMDLAQLESFIKQRSIGLIEETSSGQEDREEGPSGED